MQNFFKVAGALCLAAAIIMIVMFSCNGCPNKETVDKAVYDSAMADQAQRSLNFTREVDSLHHVIASQDSSITTLTQTKDIFKKIADIQKKETDRYANLYRKYRALSDTPMIIASCDSLVDEYQILAGTHEMVLRYSDSVINAQAQAIEIRDTAIATQRRWIRSQLTFIAKADSSYNKLYDQYTKLEKKQKRTKRLGIITAIVAFIGGVFIAK